MFKNARVGDRFCASLDGITPWVSVEYGNEPGEFFFDVWGYDDNNTYRILYMDGESVIVKNIDNNENKITLISEGSGYSFTIIRERFDNDFGFAG